ncbi:MAG TPA: chemotaxis response regulator protein-glutamate methylesterase [Pantanalinema sp.]
MSDSIRVLIVDDSAFMRRAIARMLAADPEIEIVGSVGDGAQGLEAIKTLQPDVVTMDIEMPVMDGLTALKRVMDEMPLPVIMMSTLTQNGATATLTALSLGAFDFVPKPESSMIDVLGVERELREKVRAAAHSRRSRRRLSGGHGPAAVHAATLGHQASAPAPAKPPQPLLVAPAARSGQRVPEVIGIGISTGGPPALQSLFSALPGDFPVGIVVVQHMPPGFTKPLAERLNRICPLTIREAVDGEVVEPKKALIAPAGTHLVLKREGSHLVCRTMDASTTKTWHKPSVDVLFASIAQVVGPKALAVIMTGMGNDGTAGAGAIKSRGGEIWAQDEATSVVYGMPRTVFEAGVVDRVLPLGSIPTALTTLVDG